MGCLGHKDDEETDKDGNRLENCPKCGGTGKDSGFPADDCDVCGGTGKVPPKKWLSPN
ncbi:MAG: hypothetical protein ABH837_02865 [bacterium]